MASMKPKPWSFLLVALCGWVNRKQQAVIDYLQEENRVLREHLGGKRLRLNDAQRVRLAVKGRALGRTLLREVATLFTPETILGWYRKLVARKYDGSRRRSAGRPGKPQEICELVIRMAQENPRWGLTRIQGALRNLGHEIARTTVKRILVRHGLDLAPERGRKTSWTTFLSAHFEVTAAADFFSIELLTLQGLIRTMVFFLIDLRTRKIQIAGVRIDPDGRWVEQQARNLTDAGAGVLAGKRYLLHDRDPLYTKTFEEILKATGTTPLRLPTRSPNLNAFAERMVRSIKSECLDRMIFVSEASLRRAIEAYVAHYHRERNHQGLETALIDSRELDPAANGEVRCRERLGGMLRFYTRAAA
jgi:putative transposase